MHGTVLGVKERQLAAAWIHTLACTEWHKYAEQHRSAKQRDDAASEGRRGRADAEELS